MQKVKFDPGFAPLVEHFSSNMELCSQILLSIKPLHQKKFKYKVLHQQIIQILKNNVAFYYGCLIWAFSLTQEFKESPMEIEGNAFLNLTDEEIDNYDFFEEIDFITNYLTLLEKDEKYYLGKSTPLPELWIKILNCYKEFVRLNNGFTKVSKTSDIKLPETFSNIEYKAEYKNLVLNSIESKSIESLLNINIFS